MIEDKDFIGKLWKQKCGDFLFVLEKTNTKENKGYLFLCEFKKYPYKLLCRKDRVIEGSILNPQIEQVEFVDKIWPQNCGDNLKIIKKSQNKVNNEYLWECEFIKYPFVIKETKNKIINGNILNPQIEQVEFVDKIWPQNCGDSLRILKKDNAKNGYWICEFIQYPYKISRLKSNIIKGSVLNPLIEDKDFIGNIFPQNCGDSLKVLDKTDQQKRGEFLYHCIFQKYPYEVFVSKGDIKKGHIANNNLPYSNKENLQNYIKYNFIEKPTLQELSESLNLSCSHINHLINNYKLQEFVALYESQPERNIREFLRIHLGFKPNKKILSNGKEIDIFIPKYNLGIEYNGNLWHSNHFKYGVSNLYHQEKSLYAKQENIRLIHIWEWEWTNNNFIIKSLIKSKLGIFDKKIGASKCKIKELDYRIYADFCNENHLQGKCGAKVKLGLFYQEELVQVMSFGSPRFTDKYEWEIIRECSKLEYCIIGGKQKLWKYFVKNYNPSNCISYCDFSKFEGDSYLKLGFKKISLNKPGFVWYNNKINEIYWRNPYHNQELKEKGYLKIYDCGQLVFTWFNKN